jgi:tripartite-type tricarboxylate transporter receptor subunit TctC
MMWNVRLVVALALTAVPVGGTLAQPAKTDYPSRPIRYVAASAPGGASDLIARTLGPALSEGLGVQFIVDNRPGVGNTIGAEVAAKAVPDGYTVFGCNIASLAVSPALYKRLNYDPERDFAVLGRIASNPNVLTVHPTVPAKTVKEFVSLVKSRPGKLNYGSAGVGTSPQLSMELFRTQADLNIVHIPYKGASAALLDLVGGRIDAMFSTVPSVLPAVRNGKVRALAVTSTQRDTDLPDVPTFAESGMQDFEVTSWQGLCTQSAVPPAILERLRSALAAALALPDTRKRLVDQGFQFDPLTAEKFAAFARSERAKWAKLVKDVGIQPQ